MSWPFVTLSEVVSVNPRPPKYLDNSQQVSFIGMASASNEGLLLDEEVRVLSETKKGFTYFEKSDVLLAKITPCFENGKCLRANQISNPIGFGSTEFHVLRVNPVKVDSTYLFYMVWSNRFRSLGEASMSGAAGQKRVSAEFIKEFEFPLPPLVEQKRLAAILDKADAIRRKRQQAIQIADEFLGSVFLDMFGDPLHNPKGWTVKSISECLSEKILLQVQDGNHGNAHPKVSDFVKEGIPFVTANVVRRGKLLFDECYYLGIEWLGKLRIGFAKPRDVLISHKGSLGFTAVLDDSFDNYIFSPQTTYYRVDESRLIPEYLKAYFDTTYFQRLFAKEGIQSTRAYLGITRQKDLPVMLADFNVQQEYVDIVKHVNGMIEKLVRSGIELPVCFDSLAKKAFAERF